VAQWYSLGAINIKKSEDHASLTASEANVNEDVAPREIFFWVSGLSPEKERMERLRSMRSY